MRIFRSVALDQSFRPILRFNSTEYLRHNQQDGRLKDNHVPLPGRSIFSNTEGDSRWTMDRSTAIDAPMDSAGGA
ncbi:MAG: hypothetical protein DMG12_27785 [Acidobacteria bacterium]|nr:MAG: hypothetical protein DMG12_27785 [Acidobacteriota bacterium]